MIPILYDTNTEERIGFLNDTTRAIVHEELNGAYYLELDYLVSGSLFNELKVNRIIQCTVSNPYEEQPTETVESEDFFRIVSISNDMNGICRVVANHISYDLLGYVVLPFTATGIRDTLRALRNNAIYEPPFRFITNIDNSTTIYTKNYPISVKGCLGGEYYSILQIFGGEYYWRGYTVSLLDRRGNDNGYVVRYGYNLTSYEDSVDISNTWTGVIAYWNDDTSCVYGTVQYIDGHASCPFERILTIDVSDSFETQPTIAELNAEAVKYRDNNNIGVPNENITLSYIDMGLTENYNDYPFKNVELGDTIHVYYEALKVQASARVVCTEWNVLMNRMESVEIGRVKREVSSTLYQMQNEINNLKKRIK